MDGNKSQGIGLSTIRTETNTRFGDDYYFFGNLCNIVIRYSDLVIIPTVGIVGLVGNVLSGVIMVKDGFGRPSNILLLGLAVGDFCALLESVNAPRLLLYAPPGYMIWFMELDLIILCYNLSMVINFIFNVGGGMSTSLTVFITLERVVAVYLPLRFSRLITPKKATFVVILSVFMAMPFAVISLFQIRLATAYFTPLGGWIGTKVVQVGWKDSWMEFMKRSILVYILPTVPTTIVSIGCVLIGVKLTLTVRQRKRLAFNTRRRRSSARTRTLFMVSFIFTAIRVFSLLLSIPQLTNMYNGYDATYFISLLYKKLLDFLLFFNSSCNFFVYTIFNPKFRKLIKQQLLCDCKIKKSN